MMPRNPWPSLLMMIAVVGTTAYALGHAVILDSPPVGTRAVEAAHESFPAPTESEVSDIRRALMPKIEINEPLLVRALRTEA